MSETLPYGIAFQDKVVAMLFRARGTSLPHIVKPSYFEHPINQILVKQIAELQRKLHVASVTADMLRAVIRREYEESDAKLILKRIKKLEQIQLTQSDVKFVEKEVAEFVRFRRVVHVLEHEAFGLLKAKQLDKLHTKLEAAFMSGSGFVPSHEYFGDMYKRIRQRYTRRSSVRTLIPMLDNVLIDRGVALGMLAVVLGSSGRGKSMFLTWVAKAAVVQMFPTLYITLQLSEGTIARRFDSNFTGVPLTEAQDQLHVIGERLKPLRAMYNGLLRIKGFPAMTLTVPMLTSYLDYELYTNRFDPKLVVIDYGDLMVGSMGFDQASGRYYESGSVFDELLGLCQSRHIAMWTGSQANRSGTKSELLTIESVSESYRKVMAAPLVVSLNRTRQEAQDGKARLYVAKQSDGVDDVVVQVNTRYDLASFYTGGWHDQSSP